MTQAAPNPTPPPQPPKKPSAKQDRELLTRLLRNKLTEACPPGDLPPVMQSLVKPGQKAFTYGDVVVHQLVDAACQQKEWAIEQVLDRTEGKPVQAIRQEDADRSTSEMLTDVTTQLLNRFASGKSPAKPAVNGNGASDPPAAPAGPSASRLLHLPKNGVGNTQGSSGQP